MELNDSRLIPIVKLQDIKSDIEYIRSKSNALLDAGNDDTVKQPIQDAIKTRVTEATGKLSEYKYNESFETFFETFNAFNIINSCN